MERRPGPGPDAGRLRHLGGAAGRCAGPVPDPLADAGQGPVHRVLAHAGRAARRPCLQQPELRAFHAEHDIAAEAWSPLGRDTGLLVDPVLVDIARAHQATAAQVVLRWYLDLGTVVIPKSVTPERIRANLDVFGLTLTAEDHQRIAGLDRGQRIGPDPAVYGA